MKRLNKLKRFTAVLTAAVMSFIVALPAFAAGTITVNPANDGQTYTAYKIFDVTTSGSGTSATYSYSIAENNEWFKIIANYANGTLSNGVPDSTDGLSDFSSYTVGSTIPTDTTNAKFYLTKTTAIEKVDSTEYAVWNVTMSKGTSETINDITSDSNAKALAEELHAALNASSNWTSLANQKPAASDTATGATSGTEGKATASLTVNDAPGYYFVTSSLGSVCILETAVDTATIGDKNSLPSINKYVGDVSDEKTTGSYSVGDTAVPFAIVVCPDKNNVETYVVHDYMGEGLTLTTGSINAVGYANTNDTSGTKLIENSTADSNSGIIVSTTGTEGSDPCDFEITFPSSIYRSYAKIVITYNAAVVKIDTESSTKTERTNVAKLAVMSDDTPSTVTTTKTSDTDTIYNYDFDLIKYTESSGTKTLLSGAKFVLYSDATCTTAVGLDGNATDGYYPNGIKTATEIEAGSVKVMGLKAGTYYLKETEAPDGYNVLTGIKEVVLSDSTADGGGKDDITTVNSEATKVTSENINSNTYSGGIWVENKAGSEIPSTGGIGTVIFYIAGAALLVGAGVLLIARKRTDAAA